MESCGMNVNVIEEATYYNYKWNRMSTPAVTPKEWEQVYGQAVEQMERRYQTECAGNHTKCED